MNIEVTYDRELNELQLDTLKAIHELYNAGCRVISMQEIYDALEAANREKVSDMAEMYAVTKSLRQTQKTTTYTLDDEYSLHEEVSALPGEFTYIMEEETGKTTYLKLYESEYAYKNLDEQELEDEVMAQIRWLQGLDTEEAVHIENFISIDWDAILNDPCVKIDWGE